MSIYDHIPDWGEYMEQEEPFCSCDENGKFKKGIYAESPKGRGPICYNAHIRKIGMFGTYYVHRIGIKIGGNLEFFSCDEIQESKK